MKLMQASTSVLATRHHLLKTGMELEAMGAEAGASAIVYSPGKAGKDSAVDEAEQPWAGFAAETLHGLKGKERKRKQKDSWSRDGQGRWLCGQSAW